MANRRMFSLDVVDTDRFLDMSASAQALYFHLGMRADDDGFVSSPRKIAKASNCGLDDLTLLAAKGFIIPFESGVVVVTHWKENNYIRADRYKPTRYTKEAEMLEKIGDVYQLSTTGIPTDNQMVDTWDTQDRLGKDIYNTCAPQDGERVQFDQNDDVQYTDPEKKQSQIDERKENFEKIYAIYPKKRGKQRAFGLYCQYIEKRMAEKESELIADQNEVLRYLTAVMRGESTSEEIIVEGIGDGRSKARKLEKTPSEKDRLKAAELIGKRYGLFTDKIETDVDMDLNITIDYGDE